MRNSPAKPRSRSIRSPLIPGLLLLLGIAACRDDQSAVEPTAPASELSAQFAAQAGVDAIPDRYIVTFQPGVADPAALGQALARTHGGTVHFVYTDVLQGFALSVPEQALEGIRRNPNVKTVEPDRVVTVEEVQSGATWGIDRIDQRALPLDRTYAYETSGAGVSAYVFDTGIRYDHVEFEGRARFGFDAFGGNGADCHGHGTHVAGTIGGKTWGVAKGVTLVAVRVLDCTGSGSYSGMIAGMDWVVKNNQGPAVANFSLGGSASSTLNSALTNMINGGVQTAVSAGNDGGDACLKSPASAAAAVTTGATTSSDARASYSNYGTCVDVFAPGSSITSASYSSTTGSVSMSGTSMASPHAAGVLALLRALRPELTSQQLRDWLVQISTQNIVVNANSANAHLLHSLTGETAPPEPPPTEPPGDPTALPPIAPAGLKAGVAGKTNVKLTWSDLSGNETGFQIERYAAGTWSKLAAVAANSTGYTDSSTRSGETYNYRLYAYNEAGASGYSNTATVTVGSSPRNRK